MIIIIAKDRHFIVSHKYEIDQATKNKNLYYATSIQLFFPTIKVMMLLKYP